MGPCLLTALPLPLPAPQPGIVEAIKRTPAELAADPILKDGKGPPPVLPREPRDRLPFHKVSAHSAPRGRGRAGHLAPHLKPARFCNVRNPPACRRLSQQP
jgi:hypothetical protein